jgi:hypothetical protein
MSAMKKPSMLMMFPVSLPVERNEESPYIKGPEVPVYSAVPGAEAVTGRPVMS